MKSIFKTIFSLTGTISWMAGFCQTDVLMQHNDLARTGWNNHESVLTTSNVNTSSFGLLYARAVDDQVYAQPLVVSGVKIPGVGTRNVLYLCTVNNSVYAYDADNGAVSAPYWRKSFTPAGYRPTMNTDMHPGTCGGWYNDFYNNIGLVGTPVIDKTAGTMYFVTKVVSTAPGVEDNHPFNASVSNEEYTYTTAGFHQYLHAIDITTGAEKTNSPVEIIDTIPGTGDGNIGGRIGFDPRRQFNRIGLVLSNGIVYVCFSAHCDWDPAHGWVMGYDASSLRLKIGYMTTPNDGRGGIWMSGAAPAVDASGNIYFSSGNAMLDESGFTDLPSGLVNRGESVVKLTPNALNNSATALNITDYFTPYNYIIYDDADLDFGTQVMLIPGTNLMMTAVKGKFIYVLNQAHLGGFNASADNVVQAFPMSPNAQSHSSFAYYAGSSTQWVYQFSENTLLQSYKVTPDSLINPVNSSLNGPTGASGAYMSVSSNGNTDTSAILWITHAINGCNANQSLCPGILRAVKADDVTKELWNSTKNPADNLGNFSKMNCPTIANGKVYVSTFSNQVMVYGLNNSTNNSCSSYPDVAEPANNARALYSASSSAQGSPANAFDGNQATSWTAASTGAGGGDTASLTVNLGAQYNLCNMQVYWGSNYAKAFNILGSNDGVNFALLYSASQNTAVDNTIPLGNQPYQYLKLQGVTRSSAASGYVVDEIQVFGALVNPCATPAGLAASNIAQNSATLTWESVLGATGYTIHYKSSIVTSWITRTTTDTSLSLAALGCNTGYTFTVEARCSSGLGGQAGSGFTTGVCTASCGALPTRYFSADIGDVSLAGSSCLNNNIYTLKGSGADIGGSGDEFQYAFTNLAGDEYLYAQVLSQDAADPGGKAGLMIRDSISNTAPFIFIGTTRSNGIVMEYRSASGGNTTVTTISGITAPYWLEISKTGTVYTAYISATGASNSWAQVGVPADLGFGNAGAYLGMAVTSHNNSILSTATFGNFTIATGDAPVDITNFTATNMNNQYVLLKWQTVSDAGVNYFEVQKGADTSRLADFSRVDADADSITLGYFNTYDNTPARGYDYYRLRAVDSSGSYTYSPIVMVEFGIDSSPQIYPNPASSYFTVAADPGTVKQIMVEDVLGREVLQLSNYKGSPFFMVDVVNLPAGVYIVKIYTANGSAYEQKLVKK